MKRKNFIMIISFVLLAVLLSLSVYASGYAAASSSGAVATASNNFPIALYARASIQNLLDQVSNTQSRTDVTVYASVYASQLYNVGYYPPTNSYASACVGDVEVAWDRWPD